MGGELVSRLAYYYSPAKSGIRLLPGDEIVPDTYISKESHPDKRLCKSCDELFPLWTLVARGRILHIALDSEYFWAWSLFFLPTVSARLCGQSIRPETTAPEFWCLVGSCDILCISSKSCGK